MKIDRVYKIVCDNLEEFALTMNLLDILSDRLGYIMNKTEGIGWFKDQCNEYSDILKKLKIELTNKGEMNFKNSDTLISGIKWFLNRNEWIDKYLPDMDYTKETLEKIEHLASELDFGIQNAG